MIFMTKTTFKQPLLDHNSPEFKTAKQAETALFNVYNLTGTDTYYQLPDSDMRVRVTEIGSGTPIFIVPGNTGDGFPFSSLIGHMGNHHFYLFNRPGGGLSDGIDLTKLPDIRQFVVDTIDTVLNDLHLDRVPIMAHSMGCHWALWYALAHPERVSKLILIGNPGRVMLGKTPAPLKVLTLPGLDKIVSKRLIPKNQDQAFNGLKLMGTNKETLATLPNELREAYLRFEHLPNYSVSTLSLLKTLTVNPKYEIKAADLAQIQCPTLMLWGENDTFASVDKGREIGNALPDNRFHLVKDAGHMPWLDRPEECAGQVELFLQ
ncbi:alpha beta hydrolase [Secundilactobacillus paracollinoides DSM 15502 = JCM 11969]|nr:alpha beta hydrolase [Secundilactobacillus paracollinoides DSM 15502 = JCM 11969]